MTQIHTAPKTNISSATNATDDSQAKLAGHKMHNVRHAITLAEMQRDPLFVEDGFWRRVTHIRNTEYRIFIIKDSDGLYTLGITGDKISSHSFMEHGSLLGLIDRLNEILMKLESHDVVVIGSGERIRAQREID